MFKKYLRWLICSNIRQKFNCLSRTNRTLRFENQYIDPSSKLWTHKRILQRPLLLIGHYLPKQWGIWASHKGTCSIGAFDKKRSPILILENVGISWHRPFAKRLYWSKFQNWKNGWNMAPHLAGLVQFTMMKLDTKRAEKLAPRIKILSLASLTVIVWSLWRW